MLVNNAHWCLHTPIMHALLSVTRRRFAIRSGLIDCNRVGVRDVCCINRGYAFVRSGHVLLHGNLVVIIIIATSTALVLDSFPLESLGVWREIAIIVDSRRNAVQFQSYTCRTRPSIGGCSITFDFSSSASFASSHHCASLVYQRYHSKILTYPSTACVGCVHPQKHNLQSCQFSFPTFAPVILVDDRLF
jgi:hypothetical protein